MSFQARMNRRSQLFEHMIQSRPLYSKIPFLNLIELCSEPVQRYIIHSLKVDILVQTLKVLLNGLFILHD